MVATIAWIVLAVFCVLGVAGSVLPALPGVVVIFTGALIHKLMLPAVLSWWTVAFLAVAVGCSWLIDSLGSVLGARWGGATRWGLTGALIGGLVGIFFGLPGLILGPIAGVFLAEIAFAGRSLGAAVQAGVGVGAGLAFSVVLRLLLALLCVAWIAVDAFIL